MRVLLKLSGESLAGSDSKGINFDKVLEICSEIKEVVEKTKGWQKENAHAGKC